MATHTCPRTTVRRLFELVVAQREADGPIGADTPQSAELGLLYAQCGAESELLAVSCSESLVRLVLLGHAHPGAITSGLLNAVPAAKSVVGIAGALSDLMVFQLIATTEASPEPFACPFGIRSFPHPYISLMTSRADCWPVLLRQVQRVLRWPHVSVQEHAVSLLEPFLRFVLLEPPTSQQFLQLRLSLPRVLLNSSKGKVTRLKVIQLLEDAASCLQVKTPAQVGEAVAFLDQLSGALLAVKADTTSPEYLYLRGQVVAHCLGMSGTAGSLGADTEGLTETAARLMKRGVATRCVPRVWLLTCQLAMRASDRHTSHLLNILRLCLADPAALTLPLVGVAVLPLLRVTSAPPRVGTERRATRAGGLLRDVAELLTAGRRQGSPPVQAPLQPHRAFCVVPEGAGVDVYCYLAASWVTTSGACADWLRGVGAALGAGRGASGHVSGVPDHVTLLACGVCVWSTDRKTLEAALDVLTEVAAAVPEQAPDFLPLFMFCLGYHSNPDLRLIFLEAMPKVATNKVSIAPTLKTLQMLGETESLRPVMLRLITALWRHQDRCFPYLQRMLQAPSYGAVGLDSGLDEFLVAKAACIRDICEERPHQHGADMLVPLSAILNECTRDEDEVPACLALEGLVALCEAEVVDIRTVWAVLAPKLSKDTSSTLAIEITTLPGLLCILDNYTLRLQVRPQVTRRICDLFALVPGLSTNSEDYQDFKVQTLRSLWKRTENPNGVVASAAYRALTSYRRADLTVDMLPGAVTEGVRQVAAESEPDAEPEEMPGVCFVRLLEGTQEDALRAYGDLLVSLVEEEVTGLPRGIYHSALSRQAARPSADRVLSILPDLIQQRYDKNRQPALRASLAAGLLFSFAPQLEASRDGRVRRPALVAHGRRYHQTLYALLREVPLQPTDWHCCMAVPRAWVSFMDRCYHAYQVSRTAELAMALDQGNVTDPEEHEQLANTAWLWARDKLTDLIKSASRGGPAIQANCMLALAGLAVSATRYASELDETATAAAKEASEHLGHAHWMNITASTLMSVLEPKYQSACRVFSMCQQHPGQSLSMASSLAQGAAGLALPLLVSNLLTSNTAIIHEALSSLIHQVSGQGSGRSSGRGGVFPGLGLGALIARLTDEQFAHVAGAQGKSALWEAIRALEKASFTENDSRQGCLLGLAVCLPALGRDGHMDTRTHITSLQEQLTATMDAIDPKDIAYTAAGLCVAVLAVSAYVTGHLATDHVNQLVAKVHDAHCNDVSDGGLAIALAGMCHGLGVAGHPTIIQLSSRLQPTWMACLTKEDMSTLERLCVLHGLLSLAGADASFFLASDECDPESRGSGAAGAQEVLKEVVKAVTHTPPSDVAFHTAAGWRLGQLAMEAGSKAGNSVTVPNTYQYLPETSILRSIIDRLLQAGKSNDLTGARVLVLIRCLVEGPTRALPPLNWTTFLSPIFRLSLGDEVTALCLKLAVRQAASAPTASLLLASYMLPPLWNSLADTCKVVILDSLDTIIKSVSAPKLREFLTKSLLGMYDSGEHGEALTVQEAGLRGLVAALRISDPPQAVTLTLHQTLEKLYHAIPNNVLLDRLVGECLTEVPDQLVDDITQDDFANGTSFISSSTIRCHLVAQGKQPFAWLNPAIEMALWGNDSLLLYNSDPKAELLALLAHCLYQYRLSQPAVASIAKLSQWLLELMGHVRSVANGNAPPPEGSTMSAKTVEFGMLVFSTVVVMMSGSDSSMVIVAVARTSDQPGKDDSGYLTQALLTLLPQSLCALIAQDQWKHMNGKILDWLISMYKIPTLKDIPHWQDGIKGCIRAVRHTVDFRKMATWSQAYTL